MALATQSTGDLITSAIWNAMIAFVNALQTGTSTITTTGTSTALALPSGNGPLVIFANNASLLTIQGIAAGADGQRLTIFSKGAAQIDIANQNASASAANRIINGVTGTISLAPGVGRVSMVYDTTTTRWRVDEHEQGAWITPAFSAGDYDAPGSSWTVDAGDVVRCAYLLRGRTLHFDFNIAPTSIGASAGTTTRRTIPGGFTAAAGSYHPFRAVDNSAANIGVAVTNITKIEFYKDASMTAAWTSGTTNVNAHSGYMAIEVI